MLDPHGGRGRDAIAELLRALRRAVALDEHTQRLWREAIKSGYSDMWVARRLSEIFKH